MPYGGEVTDHDKVKELNLKTYLFDKKPGKIQLAYAGAMLPKAYAPLESILSAIQRNRPLFNDLEIHFIGTGKTANDPEGYNIRPLAEKYGLWQQVIFEYPARIPYLDVLIHLNMVSGVFVLGSTEKHYTPSKVFQGVLSQKPVLAILHKDSTAIQVVRNAEAGIIYSLDPEHLEQLSEDFGHLYELYLDFLQTFRPGQVRWDQFEAYSAKAVTGSLAKLLDTIPAFNKTIILNKNLV
jgi:hypothetical protein